MKAVLFSRVSTQGQDLVQQTEIVLREIKRCGYDDEDIIKIETKESAIKLDIEERKGWQELKSCILTGDVECVFVYEISRLSRRQSMLFEIRDFLIKNKIQLVCMEPYMRLLDNNGNMTQQANFLFSIFTMVAESEMMLKKERMMRGKIHKMKQGIFIGGSIPFGYRMREDRKLVRDENQARVVRMMFDLCEQGYGATTIAKHLIEIGEIESVSLNAAAQTVRNIIINDLYVGVSKTSNYVLPQIITQEQFDNCVKARKQRLRAKQDYGFVYYSQGLLFNTEDGRMLSPSMKTGKYGVVNLSTGAHMVISLNYIDSVLLHLTKTHLKSNAVPDIDKKRNEIKSQIEDIDKMVVVINKNIVKEEKRIHRTEDLMIDGVLSKDNGKQRIEQSRYNIIDFNDEKETLERKRNTLMNNLIYVDSIVYQIDINDIDFWKVATDEEFRTIIKQTIQRVEVTNLNKEDGGGIYTLEITYTDDCKETYKAYTRGGAKKLWDDTGNPVHFDFRKRVQSRYYREKNKS